MARPVAFLQDPQYPAGVGEFQFDDGSSVYAEDPDLAMSLQQPDMRLAANAEHPDAGAVGALLAGQPMPQQQTATDFVPVPPPRLAPQQPAPEQAMVPQRPQLSPEQAEIAQYVNRPVGGSAGVDPHRMRAQGVAVPKQVTTTIKGTTQPLAPVPVELTRNVLEAQRDLHNQQQVNTAGAVMRAEEHAEREQAQLLRAQQERMRLEAEQKNKEDWFLAKRTEMQREVDDAMSRERVDPDRWFDNRNTFSQIMLMIGQTLGGAMRGRFGQDAGGLDMVARMQQADINDQERAIRDRKEGRVNQLAMFTERWGGDIEAGKTALKLAQQQVIDKEIAAYAASTRRQEVMAAADEWLAQRALEQAQMERDLFIKAMGGGEEMTKVVTEDVVQPVAASGGRAPTIEERYERAARLGKLKSNIVDAERNIEGIPDPATQAKYGDKERKLVTEYAEKKTALENARTAAKQLARAYGASIDENTGVVTPPEDGISGHGITSFVPDVLTTREGMDVRQAQDSVIAAYLKATTGAAATDAEVARARRKLFGTTDQDAARGLQTLVEELRNQEASIESEYPGDVVDTHKRRKQEVNMNRAVPGAKVKPF